MNPANAVTLLGAACSLGALGFVVRGQISIALTLMMLAVLCDRLDGMIARRLEVQSEVGTQLDSLADAVSFLVVPGVVVVLLSAGSGSAISVAILYVLAGLYRLATFNLTGNAAMFQGLPTTHAAGFFILLWTAGRILFPEMVSLVVGVYLGVVSPLMLSSIPIAKNGWLTRALQVLLLPTLAAAWWV